MQCNEDFFGQVHHPNQRSKRQVFSHLVPVRTDDHDGRLGRVAGDGAEPEVEAGVFPAEPDVPQQEVHRAVRQEKLKIRKKSVRLQRGGKPTITAQVGNRRSVKWWVQGSNSNPFAADHITHDSAGSSERGRRQQHSHLVCVVVHRLSSKVPHGKDDLVVVAFHVPRRNVDSVRDALALRPVRLVVLARQCTHQTEMQVKVFQLNQSAGSKWSSRHSGEMTSRLTSPGFACTAESDEHQFGTFAGD